MLNVMEERAMMCFNTGNLLFKRHFSKFFWKGYDRWCLVFVCDVKDIYKHSWYRCKHFKTRCKEGEMSLIFEFLTKWPIKIQKHYSSVCFATSKHLL